MTSIPTRAEKRELRRIDPALHQRVIEEMTIVSDALDAAVANPSDSNLYELHHSTDRLMRALGRVLIEIGLQRSLPQPSWAKRAV